LHQHHFLGVYGGVVIESPPCGISESFSVLANWTAILVETNKATFTQLKRLRPEAILVNAALLSGDASVLRLVRELGVLHVNLWVGDLATVFHTRHLYGSSNVRVDVFAQPECSRDWLLSQVARGIKSGGFDCQLLKSWCICARLPDKGGGAYEKHGGDVGALAL